MITTGHTRLFLCLIFLVSMQSMCVLGANGQVPTLRTVLAPALKMLDTVHNYRCSFRLTWKSASGTDTFTHHRSVVVKRIDSTTSYYKATDDLSRLTRFKDSAGYHAYSHYNQILEAGINEQDFGLLGYEFLDPLLLNRLLASSVQIVSVDSSSIRGYYIIDVSKPDTFGNTNMKYRLWLNRSANIVDRFTFETDFMEGHQYANYVLRDYAFNVRDIDDSIRIDRQTFPVRKRVDYAEVVKKRADNEAFLRSLVLNKQAENFTGRTITGDNFNLANIGGSVILLDFTYKACAGCVLAQKTLVRWDNEYRERGLRIIAVNPVDKDAKALREYYSKQHVKYPTVMCTDYVADLYRVSGYPTFVLIDKDRIVRTIIDGFSDKGVISIEKSINALLR